MKQPRIYVFKDCFDSISLRKKNGKSFEGTKNNFVITSSAQTKSTQSSLSFPPLKFYFAMQRMTLESILQDLSGKQGCSRATEATWGQQYGCHQYIECKKGKPCPREIKRNRVRSCSYQLS